MYNTIEEISIERNQLTSLGNGLAQIVKRYETSEKLLTLPYTLNPIEMACTQFTPDYVSRMPVKKEVSMADYMTDKYEDNDKKLKDRLGYLG